MSTRNFHSWTQNLVMLGESTYVSFDFCRHFVDILSTFLSTFSIGLFSQVLEQKPQSFCRHFCRHFVDKMTMCFFTVERGQESDDLSTFCRHVSTCRHRLDSFHGW